MMRIRLPLKAFILLSVILIPSSIFWNTSLFARTTIEIPSFSTSTAIAAAGNNKHELNQFSAGGHVLGFKEKEMVVAAADHALRIEFVNAQPVFPIAKEGPSVKKGNLNVAKPLNIVTYPDLWEGVDLVFEKGKSGFAKSTYYIAPGIKPFQIDRIRLRYNVPVEKDKSGGLLLAFKTGQLRESAPIAWQDIQGKRRPVEVSFHIIDGMEAGFRVGKYDSNFPLIIDPELSWHTFMGSPYTDWAESIAVDGSGNVYVTGDSNATWGIPVNAHAGDWDAFVAKLNSDGTLLWNTFMGSANTDYGIGIVVDGSGNVYVAGECNANWGTPIIDHAGNLDAFVAKLDGSSGELQWNTFMGSSDNDSYGIWIVVDDFGDIYTVGNSNAAWGTPVNDYEGNMDAFVAKLNSSGVLQWNTFLGSLEGDNGNWIAVDGSGYVYVAGNSYAAWGTPVNDYEGNGTMDVFVAKLNSSSGELQWNTFMGSANTDKGWGIAVDGSGSVYVTGESDASWGDPVNAYEGDYDGFVAKLVSSGSRQWNTFIGSASYDRGFGIAVDGSNSVYVAGNSYANWGTPIIDHAGNMDAFVAKLNGSSGELQWNMFMGSVNTDGSFGITLNGFGNAYVSGSSDYPWGDPVYTHVGGDDAFVAKIITSEIPAINLPETPTAISPANESVIAYGTPIIFRANDFNDLDGHEHIQTKWKVKYYHREDSAYDMITFSDLTSHQLTEPQMYNIEPGLKYVWQVQYIDETENASAWSAESYFKVGVSVSESLPDIPAGVKLADFSMISIVHWPDDPSPTAVFNIEYDTHYYRFGTYDPIAGAYIEIGENLEMVPGKAYWILAREGLIVNFNGVLVNQAIDMELHLHRNTTTGNGWNMIAPPNDADYLWGSVLVGVRNVETNEIIEPVPILTLTDDSIIDRRVWKWNNGSYVSYLNHSSFVLKSYNGYWVKANKKGAYLVFPHIVQIPHASRADNIYLAVKDKIISWLKKFTPRSNEALADNDTPPMPMGAFEESSNENIFDGCFIDTLRY
jgi:hypothetical protein